MRLPPDSPRDLREEAVARLRRDLHGRPAMPVDDEALPEALEERAGLERARRHGGDDLTDVGRLVRVARPAPAEPRLPCPGRGPPIGGARERAAVAHFDDVDEAGVRAAARASGRGAARGRTGRTDAGRRRAHPGRGCARPSRKRSARPGAARDRKSPISSPSDVSISIPTTTGKLARSRSSSAPSMRLWSVMPSTSKRPAAWARS